MTLTEYMRSLSLTDQRMADAFGCSINSIRKFRRGERTPRPLLMRRIVAVTHGKVTPNDFLAALVDAPAQHSEQAPQ